jgi:hypothetical protein
LAPARRSAAAHWPSRRRKNGIDWLGGVASKFGGPIAGGYLAKEAADVLDPGGNFWGLTSPIDEYFKRHFGWNPANAFEPVKPPEGAAYDPLYDPNSPRNVDRTRGSLYRAGYLSWGKKSGYHDTGELEEEEDRESRRGWAASPGAKQATIDALGELERQAARAGDQMQALNNQPITPKVETSGLERAAALLHDMAVQIGIINGQVGTMHAVPAAIGGGGGSRSGALHDGPEVR